MIRGPQRPLGGTTTRHQGNDVDAPVLVSSTVTPTSVDISTGSKTVTITVTLTDATGAETPFASLDHESSGQSVFVDSFTLVSGTTKNGTWRATESIAQGRAPGTWTTTLFPLEDSLGNSTSDFVDLAPITV